MFGLVGESFSIWDDLENAAETVATFEQQKSWASLALFLHDLNQHGFNKASARLHREKRSELWTFSQRGFLLAIQVPGDGRAETYGSTLVLLEHGEDVKRSNRQFRDAFLSRAEQRLSEGHREEW